MAKCIWLITILKCLAAFCCSIIFLFVFIILPVILICGKEGQNCPYFPQPDQNQNPWWAELLAEILLPIFGFILLGITLFCIGMIMECCPCCGDKIANIAAWFEKEAKTPTVTTSSLNVSMTPQIQQQQIQHIDANFSTGKMDNSRKSVLILGTAIAIYPYDAAQDDAGGTTISLREGDEVLLLERDMGDGWTRVRNHMTSAEGFVPTSYLECRWYPNID